MNLYKYFLLLICNILVSHFAKGQCNDEYHNSTWYNSWISCVESKNPNPTRSNAHWIMYELDTFYYLHQSYIWNFNNIDSLDSGIKTVALDYSLDGKLWRSLDTIEVDIADGSKRYRSQPLYNFDSLIVKHILLSVIENYGGICAGFSEVKFDANPYLGIPLLDKDGDGYFSHEDCDDSNSFIFPGAAEIANNNIDEDCDGMDKIVSHTSEVENQVTLTPNPASEKILISNPNGHFFQLDIYDVTGKYVAHYASNGRLDLEIIVNELNPGLYFFKFVYDSYVHIEEVLII